jgi:hypothetical protein
MSASTHRRRLFSAALVPAIIVAGLLSRRSEWVHAAFGKYPGDALWTVMVYCLVAALGPGLSRVSVTSVALLVSFAVEFSQLLRHPWLDSVRGTVLGHLVLGSTFNAPDLAAYAVGALAAFGADSLLSVSRRSPWR